MSIVKIQTTGFKEFSRELKKLEDGGLTRELRDVNYQVAEHVVSRALGAASTKLLAHAFKSLKAGRSGFSAFVKLGGPDHPEAMGAEFGGRGRRTTRQFQPWRGNGQSAGYALYPTIRGERDAIIQMHSEGVAKITARAFPQ